MAVTSDAGVVSYAGNGSTSTGYVVPWKFWEADDLAVYVDGVATTAFTTTGDGADAGGEVLTTSAIPSTSTVVIEKGQQITQPSDYYEGMATPKTVMEESLDRATMAVQTVERLADRGIKVPAGENGLDLDSASDRANTTHYYGSAGALELQTDAQVAARLESYFNIESGAVSGKGFATCADAAARAALAPAAAGQGLVQLDDWSEWVGLTTTTGDWERKIVDKPAAYKVATAEADLETANSTIYVMEALTMTADKTVPASSRLVFGRTGAITTGGYTLRILGRVDADPLQQIFTVTAPGEVKGTLGGVHRHVAWWGAAGGDSGNAAADWLGIQSAIKCAETVSVDLDTGTTCDEWAVSTAYVKGYRLFNNTGFYQCILGHTSAADDEPGVGVNEATYWATVGTTTVLRGTSNSVAVLQQTTYYIDRPLDLRGYRSSLVSQRGITYPSDQVSISGIDSAHWDDETWRRYPADYPNTGDGTTAMIFMGIMAYNRASDGAEQMLTNQYNQSLQGVQCEIGTIAPAAGAVSGIFHEGSLEENTLLRHVTVANCTGYGFGGSRYTTFNGFRAHMLNVFAPATGVPICFMAVGTSWELARATLNAYVGSTNCQYIARVGGRNGMIRNVHMESAQTAGIDVVYNWYGASSTPGSGGSSPSMMIHSISAHSFASGAPVLKITNQEANVHAANLMRSNAGEVIEDTNTGRTSNGTAPYTGDSIRAIAMYSRQADTADTTPLASAYHVLTTDPDMRVYADKSVTVSTSGTTDNLDVSDVEIVLVDTGTAGAAVTLQGLTGGRAGQVIDICVIDATYNTVLDHNGASGNQDLFLNGKADVTLTADYGGTRLYCDGSNWFEMGR